LVAKQHVIFYRKLTLIHDLCKNNDYLVNQLSNLRTLYEEFDEKIFVNIDWHNSAKGRSTDLPRIEGS